jgi:hypothetical protein
VSRLACAMAGAETEHISKAAARNLMTNTSGLTVAGLSPPPPRTWHALSIAALLNAAGKCRPKG